jgi:hypothetical protein
MMGTSEWGLAIAGAGPGDVIDKFGSSLASKLRRQSGQFNQAAIERETEDELNRFNSKYVKSQADEFHMIVCSYDRRSIHRLLYKGSCFAGQNVVLKPIDGECQAGMGVEIWRLLSDTLYNDGNLVADNARLAVFATRLAIKYASGVDDPIQMISYTMGDQFCRLYTADEIRAIETELTSYGFQDALDRYWRLHNPPTHVEQLRRYRSVRGSGDELTLLDGVKIEELCTVAARKRASKIFHRNTDKLQQYATLAHQRRLQLVAPRGLPASVGNNHT